MFVVIYRKIFYVLTSIVLAISIGAVAFLGLPFGVDFTGGSILEISYQNGRPEKAILENRLNSLSIGAYSLRETGDTGYLLRLKETADQEVSTILNELTVEGNVPTQDRFSSVGPTIGQELRTKAVVAIVIVVLVIVAYIAFVFRKVSQPISSWKYGVITILALLHDIIVPLGAFAIMAYLTGSQVDVLL